VVIIPGSRAVTPPTEFNWTHLDRLGSPIAISAENGSLREKLAYDAWGKRRTLTGANLSTTVTTPTPDSLDGVVDNRGFTGHEMLDQLDLVHMNGRIYDPLVGRFLSADPILQDPMNGQSYNRYSYVLNNPTNLTDPTGFESTGFGSWISSMMGDDREEEKRRTENTIAGLPKGEVKDSQGNARTDPKNGAVSESVIQNITPTFAQKTIAEMKGQAGYGLIGATLLEDASKFLGTTGITTNQGVPYDYLANQFGCQSADCKSQATASAISFGLGFVGTGARAVSEVAAAAKGISTGAESAKQAADLSKHLGYAEKYGKGGVKELESGSIRYYGELKAPNKPGESAGARYVHEYDSVSGKSRGWMETVDHNGNVRQVRPELNNGTKTYYKFDSNGNYTGSR